MGLGLPLILIHPCYSQGFARSAGESANPGLWRGLVGAWIPGLGHSGDTLFDWSGQGHHGTFGGTKGSEYPEWVMKPNGYAIQSPGVGNGAVSHIGIGDWLIKTGRITMLAKVGAMTGAPSDPRIVSRGNGTALHDWMLGAITSQDDMRTRHKIDGVTQTDVTVGVFTENNIDRFVVSRFDGTNVEHLHFRQGATADSHPMNIVQYAHAGDLVSTGTANYSCEIGRQPGAVPYGSWGGLIYFVYVYNRPLRDAEVMALYEDNYALFRMRPRVFSVLEEVGPNPIPVIAMNYYRRRRAS